MPQLEIQISVEDEGWPEEGELQARVEQVLLAAAEFLAVTEKQPYPEHPVEISLVFTSDEAIREINAEWRGKDKPTNVLSFPAYPLQPGGKPGPMLGDIVLARETIERESVELDKSVEIHLTHLLVHGFLHLFGYD
ncbi:MAG: rRNA maturation RNase YbeY, partial [Pseudorhizobium sp.]